MALLKETMNSSETCKTSEENIKRECSVYCFPCIKQIIAKQLENLERNFDCICISRTRKRGKSNFYTWFDPISCARPNIFNFVIINPVL